MKLAVRFKFIQNKSGELNTYHDEKNVVALYIFKSGWKGKYECVEEWGEYGSSDSNLYTAEDINHIFVRTNCGQLFLTVKLFFSNKFLI